MQLKDLKDGVRVEGIHALVEKAEASTAKNGKPYLRLTVRDSTTSLDGVMWDYAGATPPPGHVISFSADVSTYNGQLQLKFLLIEPSPMPVLNFARSTHLDADAMWEDIKSTVDSMTEPLTQDVTREILGRINQAFRTAPAAKSVHNAWYGGLLEHVWSLTRLADFVVPHYQRHYEPRISRDKVMFGLILHDAGKVIEYDYATPAFNLTPEGIFANHMVLGPAWVYEQANKWWAHSRNAGGAPVPNPMSIEEFKFERAHLMHVLAAHHGRIDWGSPVKPASLEAILVHHLDNLDSKMLHAWEFITNRAGQIGHFSERSHIEGTQFYNYK